MSLSEHEEKRMYIQLVLVSKLRRLLLAPAENKLSPIEQASFVSYFARDQRKRLVRSP